MPRNISIQTSAFKEGNRFLRDHIDYIQGSIENKSKEPESRFEIKNMAGSVGKIRIEGAASRGGTVGERKVTDVGVRTIRIVVVPMMVLWWWLLPTVVSTLRV